MFPKPFINYIPQFYKRDAKLTVFADKHDDIMGYIEADILGLNTFIDPMRCPAELLEHLDYYLNAGCRASDTEAIKRKKIKNAVKGHKQRGSFNLDAKPKIDAIAGGDSKIIRAFDKDDWILVGDGTEPSAYYWAAMGCDGIDEGLGISLIGAGTEIEVSGNIYIDVDNAALSASQQAQIQLDMSDICPDYFYVHFGYINLLGQFIEYFLMG